MRPSPPSEDGAPGEEVKITVTLRSRIVSTDVMAGSQRIFDAVSGIDVSRLATGENGVMPSAMNGR